MKNKKSIIVISLSGIIYLASAIAFAVVSIGNSISVMSSEESSLNEEFGLRSKNGFFDSLHNYNVYKSFTFTEVEINSFPKATQNLIRNKIDYFSWTSQLSQEYTSYLNNQVKPFYPNGSARDKEIARVNNIILINSNAIIFLISSIIWFLATIGIIVGVTMIIKNKNKK
ncbi:MAG: hypothetical protein ACRDCF_02650 [Mycoplasmoidaceae bacterium]